MHACARAVLQRRRHHAAGIALFTGRLQWCGMILSTLARSEQPLCSLAAEPVVPRSLSRADSANTEDVLAVTGPAMDAESARRELFRLQTIPSGAQALAGG